MIKDNSCDIKNNIFEKDSCDMQKLKLLCITCPREDMSYQKQVELACMGGADMIQLRDKTLSRQSVIKLARELQDICKSFDVIFTLNDDPLTAKEAGCDGVHIGQSDMSYLEARKVFPYGVIGVSAQTQAEALAIPAGVDYIGLGPVFATPMKEGPKPVGLQGLKEISAKVKIPLIAIGGVDISNAAEVIKAGAHGIAVIRAVCGAGDIKSEAKKLKEAILSAEGKK